MFRLFLVVALIFGFSAPASATKQYGWNRSTCQGCVPMATSSLTCDALKVGAGLSLTYACMKYGGSPVTGLLDYTTPNIFYQLSHPTYGVEPTQYRPAGPLPDKCEAPRYSGPDTTKPIGSQCSRVACVAGDTTGAFEEPIRYYKTSTNVTLQSFYFPATSQVCVDGCVGKPSVNSGNCPGRVHSGDVSYQFCNQVYLDTATKCPMSDAVPTQPAYVPPVVTPPVEPPAETCGVAGKPACPDPTAPPSTCGGSGQPSCYPGNTCGGPGQPACAGGGTGAGPGDAPPATGGSTGGGGTTTPPPTPTPTPTAPPEATCGVTGKPACATDSTCGGTGQPACGYGNGSGSPGSAGSCGGLNQPMCSIDGTGTPTGADVVGDLSGVEGKNTSGQALVSSITLTGIGTWFPQIPTAACVNPTVTGPFGGTYTFAICSYVDTFSILVSAVICVFAMFGSVRNIQDALKA